MDHKTYSIFSVQSDKGECPRICVTILGAKMEMGVDTQASINAISSKAYYEMAVRPALTRCTSKVFSFDGQNPMTSLGKFTSVICANGRSVEAEFVVFENVKDNLLSFHTSQKLKLIQLLYQVAENDFRAQTIKVFPDLFSGKIGKLKGVQIKLHIDDAVKSSVAPERRIPYHFKEKFEAAIDDMIKDDIIEPVVNEPTHFISEMGIVETKQSE